MKAILRVGFAVMFAWGAWLQAENTVVDTVTGLQWQDSFDAQHKDTVWRDADKFCKALVLDGFDDWRLPTRAELRSLVSAVQANKVSLKHAVINGYWTSEAYEEDPINVWAVYTGNGHAYDADRCDEAHVRCVRDR